MRTIQWITASLGAARLGRRRAEGRLAGLFRTFHPLGFPSLLERLAIMVRGADTARLDLSPAAPGLLAASLGLLRIYDDDLEQLNAGVLL
jgi:hypothetical protein